MIDFFFLSNRWRASVIHWDEDQMQSHLPKTSFSSVYKSLFVVNWLLNCKILTQNNIHPNYINTSVDIHYHSTFRDSSVYKTVWHKSTGCVTLDPSFWLAIFFDDCGRSLPPWMLYCTVGLLLLLLLFSKFVHLHLLLFFRFQSSSHAWYLFSWSTFHRYNTTWMDGLIYSCKHKKFSPALLEY